MLLAGRAAAPRWVPAVFRLGAEDPAMFANGTISSLRKQHPTALDEDRRVGGERG